MCTNVIDIPYDRTIQLVLTAIGSYDNAHPIHLHGHTFHVVKVGYPEYDPNTGFIAQEKMQINGKEKLGSIHTTDIYCKDKDMCKNAPDQEECSPIECTMPGWPNGVSPPLTIDQYTVRKDTVIVPAGGYVVINFKADNPGFWFLHCHIEVHQLQGMAIVVNEAFEQQGNLKYLDNLNKCGDVSLTVAKYQQLLMTNKRVL